MIPESRSGAAAPPERLDPAAQRLILLLDEDEPPAIADDPGTLILTCANCGARLDERKCKLICRCGYFLSCSDYY